MAATFMTDPYVWYSGAPFPVSHVPSWPSSAADTMTLVERMQNLATWAFVNIYYSWVALPVFTQKYRDRFGQNFPHLRYDVGYLIRSTDPRQKVPYLYF